MRMNLRVSSVAITALICLALVQSSEAADKFAMNMLGKFFASTTRKTLPPKPLENLAAQPTTKSPMVVTKKATLPSHRKLTLDEMVEYMDQDQFEPWLQMTFNESIEGDNTHFCIDLVKVPVANLTLSGKFCVELDPSTNNILLRYDGKIWRDYEINVALQRCIPMQAPIKPFEVCLYFYKENQTLCTFFRLTLLEIMQNDLQLWCFNLPANPKQVTTGT